MPHGHRDTNTGPGSVAPPPHGWGRELSTRGHVAGRHDNGSEMMINSNNPNTPPRGSTLLSFLRRKKEKKEQIRRSPPHTGLQGRLELPPGLRQTPSRASPGRDGGRTRYHLPSRCDGVEADRGHRWKSRRLKQNRRSLGNPERRQSRERCPLHHRRSWVPGRGRRPRGSTLRRDNLPQTLSRRGWHRRQT